MSHVVRSDLGKSQRQLISIDELITSMVQPVSFCILPWCNWATLLSAVLLYSMNARLLLRMSEYSKDKVCVVIYAAKNARVVKR